MPRGRPKTAPAAASNRVLELRNAEGWSQEELAERVGCATSTIQRIESGERAPSHRMLHAIAKAFGREAAEILTPVQRPADPDLARVGELLARMSPQQREAWLAMGAAAVTPMTARPTRRRKAG